jgi:hypothetical protein
VENFIKEDKYVDNVEISNYQGIKENIKHELNRVAESFVIIGYHLKLVRDQKLYELDGYNTITEFAEAEYNLSQTTTSRFIAINDRYSINGSSPKLLEQYEGHGYSKLAEMLTLNDEQIKLISSNTTRAEIREIKQVVKEAENENYAPAHNAKTIENTQSEVDFMGQKKWHLPEDGKLIIEFFRPKQGREMLKELSLLFKLNPMDKETVIKAAEVINPSGHYMFRSKFVIMMFEEDVIKHSKFGGTTTEFTYADFINDIQQVFDMSDADPWVAFYGEPEPDPEPVKPEPPLKQETKKIESKPDKKPELVKKEEKPVQEPVVAQTVEEEESVLSEGEKEDEDIPGQAFIEDYPEMMPENKDIQITEQEETVETYEADIVVTTRETNRGMEETIQWHVMTDEPDKTCEVLIAVLQDGEANVIIGKYFMDHGFQDNANLDIEYKYWAFKPKTPIGC